MSRRPFHELRKGQMHSRFYCQVGDWYAGGGVLEAEWHLSVYRHHDLLFEIYENQTGYQLGLMIAIGGLTYFVVLVILKDSVICNIGKAIIKKIQSK